VKSGPGGVPGEEEKSHLWRSYAVDKVLAKPGLTASQLTNRPLSWPGSEYAGTHPRTKGAQCFPGGLRDRIRSPKRMTAIAWQRQQWSSATTIRSSKKRKRHPAEEKAPNSRSSTELPGANRSWVAVGDDPAALQQRGWDDVKTEGLPLSGPHIECERMSSLVGEMSDQLFDGRQDKGTIVFFA